MTVEGRQADARRDLADAKFFRTEESPAPRPSEGRGRAGRFGGRSTAIAAPALRTDEVNQAAEALRGALEAGQVKYPGLAQQMLQDPSKIWLLSEVQMMLSAAPNEVSYDMTADLMEGLTTTTGQRKQYEFVTAHNQTQQLFWEEIGSSFEPEDREFLIDVLAMLEPDRAHKVAARALHWKDTHGFDGTVEVDDEQVSAKDQLLLNMFTWAQQEQSDEQGQQGFFGAIDFLQEAVEQNIVSPLINSGVGLIKGAEEAARRKHLTVGQQVAYTFGVKPPERAGDFGWWSLISGGTDALVEVGADPLSWLAGLGAGIKAVKTIPMATKATKAGRAAAALRAILPKPFAGVPKQVYGGRFARVTYALGAKSVDDLLQQTVKNGIANDAMNLIKEGNLGKLGRLFPAWSGLSDEAIRTIQEAVQSPDEFIEVLKADALNEVLASGTQLDDLTRAAKASEQAAMRAAGTSPIDDATRAVVDAADDYVYHATSAKNADLIQSQGFRGGTLVSNPQQAIDHARTRPKLASDTVVVAIHKDTLLPTVRTQIDNSGFATVPSLPPMPGGNPMRAAARATVDDAEKLFVRGEVPEFKFHELMLNQNIPRDIRLRAAKDQLRLNAYNMSASRPFIINEVPARKGLTKIGSAFSWQNVLDKTKGSGRLAAGVRRTVARITPGRIPDSIHLFDTKNGVDDLRRMGEHFGLRQSRIDELVDEFTHLELGARQEWVWDTYLREIGRELGVPAFEHQLIQFYKGAGVRNYSGSGVDLLRNGQRTPILPSQITDTMPVPVDVLTQVFNRAQDIGNRSRLAKAMRFTGRGIAPSTRHRRADLVKRFRRELGEQAEGLSDDQLFEMAYSMVSPNAGLDARGIFAGKMLPKAGSVFNQLHSWFTKSMLIFRPIQWMWRVALLEEPIRAHLFNMPSLYNRPLQYMGRLREAHYVSNVRKWAEANMSWGQDVMATMLRGTKDDMLKRLDETGLTREIFGDNLPGSAREIRRGVENYIENALYGRIRPTKLNPIKKVPWAVKNRATNIKRAEKMMDNLGMPKSFDFHQEAQEIAGRLVAGYLGESVGANQRILYQWSPGMTPDEAFTHGRVWGTKLIEFVEDPFGRAALRRYAARLRGEANPDVGGMDLVNSSRWPLIAPDLRIRYANETDDLVIAERYLDEVLSKEIDHLFLPFSDELIADDLAELIDEFATTRQISTTLGGSSVEWDLRSSNYGAGVRQVGDFTASVRQDRYMRIPNNLPAPSMDPRFMAEDDRGWISRMADWTLQTFGEQATQTFNRRPAWVHEYNRWFENYRRLDVPEQIAVELATQNANRMVNHVFFNMNEAPYYIARLNRILPFFGATYEVVGTWSYKMPVAVGGTWPTGAGEFARKFDRLIDAFVNMGLLDREEEDDGSTSLTLNLVPMDSSKASDQEIGRMLQGAGFAAVNTLDQAISTLLGMEEGLGLRSQGYRLAAGHPLNPSDYGIMSFAQADVGLNPFTNIAVTALAAQIPGAGAPRREATKEGETLAQVAERLGVEVEELVRYNREIFVDTENFGSNDLYNGLLAGTIDPAQLEIPALTTINLPRSSLWDAMADTFMPFGQVESPHEFATNFIPGGLRWAMAGLALQNQPTDAFWKDSELTGIFGGLLPEVNEAQVASQLNEAFMYLEAHDLVNGKGPFTRIQEKEEEIQRLLDQGNTEAANALRAETNLDIQAFLDRAQKVAAESLILRGMTGQFMPTTPGHVRLEEEKIRAFWDTREYADNLRVGEGEARLRNFKSMEELDQYKEQLAAWITDPKGDRARAVFRQNNPQLMAYLTPKTFYTEPLPDITSYEEYQRQLESGERQPSPLHVTMWRARSAAIQSDYYNKFIAQFGNNPTEAAANALQNREQWKQLNDERSTSYQALEMWDEMHGAVYSKWREENYDDVETWAQDQINDRLNTVRDNLNILFELEDYMDIELDLEGIASLNGAIRGAIAEISNAIRDYNELTEETSSRNAYEEAINQYFEQVYIPYAQEISTLYDQIPEVGDSERQALIYEQIKFKKNEYAETFAYLNDDVTTPFPNPLEFSWQGKDEKERQVKMQQWVSRPLEWMDLDQSKRLLENNPALDGYIPSTRADFDIYQEYTLSKITLDEMFEANEITRTQHRNALDGLKENLMRGLAAQGRGKEVVMMTLTPYEKLELGGLLPENLGIFSDHVRYYKQALEVAEESPGTIIGRQIVAPLYDEVEAAFYADPDMRSTLQELGVNLQDKTAMDVFLPWLFFDYTGER